jgi:Tfp pilus assembly protein PilO
MMPAWFQQLNRRERILLGLIALLVFGFGNLFLWEWLLGSLEQARTDIAARRQLRAQQEVFVRERDLWQQRAEWLQLHQPRQPNPGEATALLDQVRQIAQKHNVLVERPNLGGLETQPHYQSVNVSLETKSPWEPLVRFLYEMQQPESFVVFESINLAIESGDPTQMRGRFRIARWFAPPGK